MNKSAIPATILSACLLVSACGSADTKPVNAAPRPPAGTSSTNAEGAELVPPGKPGAPRGGVVPARKVKGSDAEDVADAVVLTNYAVDTRLDKSPMDGLRRATRWLTADYADAVTQPIPGDGDADWTALAAKGGYTTVTVADSDETKGGTKNANKVFLARIATITSRDNAGKALKTEEIGTFVNLIRTGPSGPWRVESITTA